MDSILTYIRKRKGYARMKDLKASGFQVRVIRQLVLDGKLVKVKPGLYRLSALQPDENIGLVEICHAIPKAVISLTSALEFHDLTTHIPTYISFAVPRWYKPPKIDSVPSKAYYFSLAQYGTGIEYHETQKGLIRIYGPEKTICDCFRFRHKLGEDLALEGLKSYLKRRTRDLQKLSMSSKICRVEKVVQHYVRAIIG